MKTFFIFDVDGTLIDSNDFHALSWLHCFHIFDKRISLKQIRSQIGKGSDQLLPEFLTPKELKTIGDKISELHGAIFKARFLSEVKAFPQVPKLFREIRKGGGTIALASSSKAAEVKQFMKIARIQDLVDQITSADDAQSSKPQPDIVDAAIRKLRSPNKDSILMIGDSPFDALAATKAGIRMLGLKCGGFSAKVLKRSGAIAVYDNPTHLLKELENVMRLFKGASRI
jgi:phosphoglycolate phosphatase-like HAD superfamily hydrolase